MRVVLFLFPLAVFPQGFAEIGSVVTGTENVRPGEPAMVELKSGMTSGEWSIDWGDGSAPVAVAADQSKAVHAFGKKGVYEVKVGLKDVAGKPTEIWRDYGELVSKAFPSIHYDFNAPGEKPVLGPAFAKRGNVSVIPSFAPNLGDALRFSDGGHLRLSGRPDGDGNFFGLEFWLRPGDLAKRQVIYSSVGSDHGNVIVYLKGNKMCFSLVGSGVKSMDLGAEVKAGQWHHFGISYERSEYFRARNTVRFYRDGSLRSEESFGFEQSRPVRLGEATIGARDPGNGSVADALNGDLDEMVLHRMGIFPAGFLERHEAASRSGVSLRIAVGPDGSDHFTVDEPEITREQLVELDPDPNVDNLPVIQKAINESTPGTRLKFVAKGTGKGGGRFYLNSHNNWRLIIINKRKDLEIDGNGCELIVRIAASKYLLITDCERVAVRNLAFDVDQTAWRVGAYAMVERIDPQKGMVMLRYVKGAAKTPDVVPAGMGLWRWRTVDGTTRTLKGGVELPIREKKSNPADGSRWAYRISSPPDHKTWKTLEEVKAKGDLLQVNNAHFGGSGGSTWSCRHMTYDNLRFHAVMGMVFLSAGSDYVKVSRCRIGLPPGLTVEDRPFAAAADGFHFHDEHGGHVIFENNDIALTDDDPISLKDGVYRNIVKSGPRALKVGEKVEPGAELQLRKTSLEALDPPFSAKVVSYDEKEKSVILDADIPGDVGVKYHLLNHNHRTENWIFRGNHFHDLYGRLMIYTGRGTFENNRISGMLTHVGFSAADYDNAGRPYDIVFRRNLFERGSGDTSVWGAWPTTPVIDDVALTNNSFIGTCWQINHLDGGFISGNYFEDAKPKEGTVINLKHSSDIHVVGNLHYDPSGAPFVSADDDATFRASENREVPVAGAK